MSRMQIALIDTDNSWAFGLRLLSAELKKQGHHARTIILQTRKIRYTAAELHELECLLRNFPVVGVSCFSGGSERAHQLLAHFRPLKKVLVWAVCTQL